MQTKKVPYQLRLHESMHEELRTIARTSGKTLAHTIRDALDYYHAVREQIAAGKRLYVVDDATGERTELILPIMHRKATNRS